MGTEATRQPADPSLPEQTFPTHLSVKELAELYKAKLTSAYALVSSPSQDVLYLSAGSPPPVTLAVESRGQKGTYVTRIRGLEPYGIDGKQLAKDVSVRLACAAGVDDDEREETVTLQGRFEEEIEALLTGDDKAVEHGGVKGGEYFIPKEVVEVVFGKGVSGGKKKKS
jgi:translation initiation factor 1 (eIF-1/SUI1)